MMSTPQDKPRTAHTRDGSVSCESCGYDLRRNESGCCPECGARIPRVSHMPPQWWVLRLALGIAGGLLLFWIATSLLFRLGVL